VIASNGAADMI
jgi:hypothetical protein